MITDVDINIAHSFETGFSSNFSDNLIYFSATNNEGYPIHVEGIVIEECNSKKEYLTSLKTELHGMGSFNIKPMSE